jgi:uncharacterized protein
MLAEASRVGLTIDVTRVPRPADVSLERWLQTFPSYGYLLAVPPAKVDAVLARVSERGIAAADVGAVTTARRVEITDGHACDVVWDFSIAPFTGCGKVGAPA